MAPPRRAAAPLPPPHNTKGWLSRCRRPPRNRKGSSSTRAAVDPLATVPDDLLFDAIFSPVFSNAGDVTRCAAVCRRWGRIVAAREAAILRALPLPDRFLPHLALGFFHVGQRDLGSTRRRQLSAHQAQTDPCFVPMPSASVLLGSPFPGLPEGVDAAARSGGLFHNARPVASRGGRVVFELRSKARADGVALSVCNLMTGDVALVPPLAGDDFPGHDYACAVLTADDLDGDDAQPGSSFFSLVLVYNRRSFTALRCYTSDDAGGGWGPEFRKPGAQISGHVLHRLGPAVVLRGVVYWPIVVAAALAVRLDGAAAAAVMDVHVVPYSTRATSLPDWSLLGTMPDGRLSYVSAGVAGSDLRFLVETLDVSTAAGAEWERGESISTQLTVPTTSELELKMRWLGEKSGTLLFTIGEGGSSSGAFALNLATRSVDKLADGVECNSWRSLYGYEMDPTALLASITARFN